MRFGLDLPPRFRVFGGFLVHCDGISIAVPQVAASGREVFA